MSNNPPKTPIKPLPSHLAVIMDGNGRWASRRNRPRALGHRFGVRAARRLVEAVAERGIPVLSVFAFSQENWHRPEREVNLLLRLFSSTLRHELDALQRQGVRLCFIGNRSQFPQRLQAEMARAEACTADNTRLQLLVALGYGGQWDICQAAERLRLAGETIDTASLSAALSTADVPAPDLLIRTGGEHRISNFMLWQLAYTEILFSPVLWPEFDAGHLDAALEWFAGRQRRFGRVQESV